MKKIALLLLLCLSFSLQAQESEHQTVLTAPESWRSEIIPFPLDFAPSLNYSGFEDIRFSEGWADSTATDFFTYTFIWYLDDDPKLNAATLKANMKAYFDGLMVAVHGSSDIPETYAAFIDKGENKYKGKVEIFDAFFKKKKILLNTTTTVSYCTKAKKHIVRFNLSPQGFDHSVWDTFGQVKLKINCAN